MVCVVLVSKILYCNQVTQFTNAQALNTTSFKVTYDVFA